MHRMCVLAIAAMSAMSACGGAGGTLGAARVCAFIVGEDEADVDGFDVMRGVTLSGTTSTTNVPEPLSSCPAPDTEADVSFVVDDARYGPVAVFVWANGVLPVDVVEDGAQVRVAVNTQPAGFGIMGGAVVVVDDDDRLLWLAQVSSMQSAGVPLVDVEMHDRGWAGVPSVHMCGTMGASLAAVVSGDNEVLLAPAESKVIEHEGVDYDVTLMSAHRSEHGWPVQCEDWASSSKSWVMARR